MSEIFEWIVSGFVLALIAAVAALCFVPLVLLIDYAIGRRVAARFLCLLWVLVAVRLLLPFAPESVLSLQNLWRLAEGRGLASVEYQSVSVQAEPPSARAAVPDAIAQPAAQISVNAVDWENLLFVGLASVWFLGLVVVVVRAGVASARFGRRLRTISSVDDSVLIDQLRRVCDQVAVKRAPQLKYVSELASPALFGVFRPTLCLPEETRGELGVDQLRLIMLHEVMHMRRRDGLLSWLLTVLHAVHWFNPIAWLVSRRIVSYREMACDEGVRRMAAPSERSTYTELLVRFATAQGVANANLVGLWFASPVRRLSERIGAFNSPEKNQGVASRLSVAMLLVVLSFVGLTDAASVRIETRGGQNSVGEWMSQPRTFTVGGAQWSVMGKGDPASVESRTYDISRALAKLNEFDPHVDNRFQLLAYLKSPYLGVESVEEVDGDRNQVRVAMTDRGHRFFSGFLRGLSESGPWQVAIETRQFRGEDIETLEGIDWTSAVQFAGPTRSILAQQDLNARDANGHVDADMTARAESESWDYSPYLAFKISEQQYQAVITKQRHSGQQLANTPKITVFNGQEAQICDEAERPFVVGVHYVPGELATAAQPDIVILREGSQLIVRPLVADAMNLDLTCRLTILSIDDGGTAKLPGKQITVQTPRTSRRTISTDCRLKRGETLLIAPLTTETQGDDSGFRCYAVTPTWFLPE